MTNLRLALKNLCQHQEYKLDDIFQFQLCADVFFQKWIELWGDDKIKNYIQMLGSDHMAEYMTKCGCLYQFSNQRWEHFNALIKQFFFHRTARGEISNSGKGLKSVIKPFP